MPRHYPMKPRKYIVHYQHDSFGVMMLSVMVSGICMFLSVMGLIFSDVPSDAEIVPTVIIGSAGVGFVLTFLKLRFEHIPRKIKAHFAYTKSMKEYNRKVAEIDLIGERAESETFVHKLRKGI